MKTIEIIRNQQRVWAQRHGIAFDSRGYAVSLRQNLYSFPMEPETRLAFESARGQELRTSAGQGRMRALDSSSALLVNFFEYWVRRRVGDIARACGVVQPMTMMRFQPTCPLQLGDTWHRLHADLQFTGVGIPVLIQSEFTESYHRFENPLVGRQYVEERSLWKLLPRCEDLARRIDKEEAVRASFSHMNASRLLKLIAALSSMCGVKRFELLHLWYELPSTEADRHKDEIRRFAGCVQEEVLFRDTTYQRVYRAIRDLPDLEPEYLSYLDERYFPRRGQET